MLIIILLILIGFGGFGLGRLSVEVRGSSTVHIDDTELFAEDKRVVASEQGTKYHLPWCSGAQRIKGENRIEFGSVREAEESGYTPAQNCKGLK